MSYKPFKLEDIPSDKDYSEMWSETFIAVINGEWYIGSIFYADDDDEIHQFNGRKANGAYSDYYDISYISHYMLIPDATHLKTVSI